MIFTKLFFFDFPFYNSSPAGSLLHKGKEYGPEWLLSEQYHSELQSIDFGKG